MCIRDRYSIGSWEFIYSQRALKGQWVENY
jgi:hypothetical protein